MPDILPEKYCNSIVEMLRRLVAYANQYVGPNSGSVTTITNQVLAVLQTNLNSYFAAHLGQTFDGTKQSELNISLQGGSHSIFDPLSAQIGSDFNLFQPIFDELNTNGFGTTDRPTPALSMPLPFVVLPDGTALPEHYGNEILENLIAEAAGLMDPLLQFDFTLLGAASDMDSNISTQVAVTAAQTNPPFNGSGPMTNTMRDFLWDRLNTTTPATITNTFLGIDESFIAAAGIIGSIVPLGSTDRPNVSLITHPVIE